MADDYISNVIGKGDLFSKKLARLSNKTAGLNQHLNVISEGMHGIVTAWIPDDCYLLAVQGTGLKDEDDPAKHAFSMVEILANKLERNGAVPIGYSNIIDAREFTDDLAEKIENALADASVKFKVGAMNGESAGLGDILKVPATVSGTMIGYIKKSDWQNGYTMETMIDPQGKQVYLNSDGEGTKSQLQSMLRKPELGIYDAAAMVLDDAAKMNLDVKALMMTLEMAENYSNDKFKATLNEFLNVRKNLNVKGDLEPALRWSRLTEFPGINYAFNLNATAISLIDLNALSKLPKPEAGDYIYAVKKKKNNPRSNGITDIRKAALILLGDKYWETRRGKKFLDFMAEPSEVFYPFFREALSGGYATSVYHLSGGAFKGKLAKPLAAHGLYAELREIFAPDERHLRLMEALGTRTEDAYGKWTMNNDAFVTTKHPAYLEFLIESFGYDYVFSGRLKAATPEERGISFTAFDGTKISYKGDN